MPDDVFEGVIITDRLLGKAHIVFTQVTGNNIKTKLAHTGNIDSKLQGLLSPVRDVVIGYDRGEEIGVIPLHENSFDRVSVIAGPEFGEVF